MKTYINLQKNVSSVGIKSAVRSPSLLLIQALADCVKDLLTPFHNDTIDLVAGIDAMGFILGKKANRPFK